MPITSTHPEYNHFVRDWQDCRTAYEGQRAVKDAGVRYLPRLRGQSPADYDAYKGRALFYSITSKTLSALTGMAMDQVPVIDHPSEMDYIFKDHSGMGFYKVFGPTILEVLLTGRFGAFVDRPANGGKPYITLYRTEDIINWEVSDDDVLQMVVLRERYVDRSSSDMFTQQIKVRYRHLYLEDGIVKVQVHESGNSVGLNNVYDQVGRPMSIVNTGVPMTEIPFFCVTANGIGLDPCKSPVQDIVDINFSHYRSSADLEHGRHFTGLPTPWITGAESQAAMHIGSTKAWVIPDAGAKVGFLEFTGLGLQSLEKALAEKQAQLASLSARLIDNSSRGSEAEGTVRMRYASETSSLRQVVRSVEAFLNLVFNCVAKMEGYEAVKVQLPTDFLGGRMTAAELKAWTDAYLGGAIPKEVFIHALRAGKSLPPPGEEMGKFPDPPAQSQPQPQPTPSNTPQPQQ